MTRHIRTNTDYHYISTVWLEVLDCWETMVFKRQAHDNDQIDWSGVSTDRTKEKERAIVNHCDAIWKVIERERGVK